jgi:hypothetical protein
VEECAEYLKAELPRVSGATFEDKPKQKEAVAV